MPFKNQKQRKGFFAGLKGKDNKKAEPVYQYRVTKTETKTVRTKRNKEDADIAANKLTERTGMKHNVVTEKTSRKKLFQEEKTLEPITIREINQLMLQHRSKISNEKYQELIIEKENAITLTSECGSCPK